MGLGCPSDTTPVYFVFYFQINGSALNKKEIQMLSRIEAFCFL
jgi:hypothetical protein